MSASPMLPAPTKPTFLPLTLIYHRVGPGHGPPHPPTLGRAPAEPWRASGLTQDISSPSPLRQVGETRRARAEDRGAHPHHGGALLDGDLEVAAHPHRQLRQPVALRQLAQRAEPAARVLGALDGGRDRHQPAQPQPAERRQRLHRRLHRLRRPAALRRLQADVDLHERVHRTAPRAGAAGELARAMRSRTRSRLVRMSGCISSTGDSSTRFCYPRNVMPPLSDLALMIQSRYPFIAVETSEEDRLETTLSQVAGDLRVPFFVWTVTNGLHRHGLPNAIYDSQQPLKSLNNVAAMTGEAL